VLQALSSVKWGASQKLLGWIYVAFIQSKMEYGSTILGNISKSLEPAWNCSELSTQIHTGCLLHQACTIFTSWKLYSSIATKISIFIHKVGFTCLWGTKWCLN
jgi:hypothetical protein